jgi:hypothetical protein
MKQNPSSPSARRAQHQQRRATTALKKYLQRHLSGATETGAHLDLEVVITTDFKCHVRVAGVADGLVTGVMLLGFRHDLPRRCGADAAIRIDSIMMVERIIGTEASE